MHEQFSYYSYALKKEKNEKRKREMKNVEAQEAKCKRPRCHVNFFTGCCSVSLQPNLKPNFINLLK